LLNQLNNAHDAIEKRDEKWVKIQAVEKNGSVEISVTDSGTGLWHELREKVMMPFFTTKELGKGTGLSLSISKGIIESHCGKFKIDATSEYTRFVRLLLKNQTQQAAA
jgi:two-component system sensor histidine kinase DctS